MTFDQLGREPEHLLLKCISGSRAYNLALPSSDTDIKGIFILPRKELYGLTYTGQVANDSNDIVFYEIGRFLELLCKNNPNILELLSTPENSMLFRHPLMDLIRPEDYLSKLCLDSFAGYARTQIKKARGLNKKINQTFGKERKSVLEFCYVVEGKGTVPLKDWLGSRHFCQEDCGLVTLSHFRDAYLIYHEGASDIFKGIISADSANDVQLSAVPKGIEPSGLMYFNKDAYSIYCREYAGYWQWVEDRNDERYQSTLSHGRNYDAKHMMHTFRLLSMAEEIAVQHRVVVHREDRNFLLKIRAGEFEFGELMKMVEERMDRIESAYAGSTLPAEPDYRVAEEVLVRVRDDFYNGTP